MIAWVKGSCFKAKPEVAKEVMDGLAAEGRLSPAELVEVSRPKNAPLHQDFFSLNDRQAAQKWREYRAGIMIASIVVVPDEPENSSAPVRAFFNIEKRTHAYIPTEVIFSDDAKTERLLAIALRELAAFQAKYRNLAKLAGVMDAIDTVLKDGEPE